MERKAAPEAGAAEKNCGSEVRDVCECVCAHSLTHTCAMCLGFVRRPSLRERSALFMYLFIRGYQGVRVVLYCLKICTQGPSRPSLRDYVAVGDIVHVPKFFSDSSGEEYIGGAFSSQEGTPRLPACARGGFLEG